MQGELFRAYSVEEMKKKEEHERPPERPTEEAKRATRENDMSERVHDMHDQSAENGAEFPKRTLENRLFLICYLICTHWLFTFFITMLILGNTIILAMDRYPIDEAEFKALGKQCT